jgi:hypothetical protein
VNRTPRIRPRGRGRGRPRRAEVDAATLVAGIRSVAAEVWLAGRAYQIAVGLEADALVDLVMLTADGAPEVEVARARATLTAALSARDDAAALLGIAGPPDALAPQLLAALAGGRLAVTR